MRRPVLPLMSALALSALAITACGSGSGATAGSTSTSSASPTATSGLTGEIIVFAAASLTDSFEQIGKAFEVAHPGTSVTFSFGASSALATQITQGAPADVFASASAKTMDTGVAEGAVGTPTTFAVNVMQIAVPPSNPASITGVADLAKPAVKVALCQVQVPCGATAAKVFENAKITVKPVTEEADVKATLAKVQLGEVDAAVVYVSDVRAAGDAVVGVAIPAEVNASTSYPIATVNESKNPELAQAFVDYVLSPDASAVLGSAGFAEP